MKIDHLEINEDEIVLKFIRSSGAGGQNVNKVNSKVELRWDVEASSGLPYDVKIRFKNKWAQRISKEGLFILSSDRFRDQKKNIDDVLDRMASMIAEILYPPKIRKKTKASRGSVERRLAEKKVRAGHKRERKKVDYD